MLRLKPLSGDGEYPAAVCAASRCQGEAVVVDATRRLSNRQVPLCEHHWQIRCGLEPEEPEEMVIEIIEREPPARNQRLATRRGSDRRQLILPLG